MAASHPLGRSRGLLVVPIALLCLAVPPWALCGDEGAVLFDDTRAWFGAGTSAGVPAVTQVNCFPRRTGSRSYRGVGMTDWMCSAYLTPAKDKPQPDPFKTMPYDEAMKEYNRRLMAQLAAINDPGNRMPGYVERALASNRTGDLPTVRRLSPDGEPHRFGVVWSGWELASRWLKWALISAMFFGIGIGILLAARSIWRRRA